MKQIEEDWKETFQAEFLNKNFVTFDQCAFAYTSKTTNELLAEMALLISPRFRAVPFTSSGRRYYALMDALIRSVGTARGIPDHERSRMVDVCIDFVEYVRRQTPTDARVDFGRALSATLDAVDLLGRYPQVAQLIADRDRGFRGPFQESEIGSQSLAAE